MAFSNYSPEMMSAFKMYAMSLGPTPRPEYPVLHNQIQVPFGYLPVRIAQFSRGRRPTGEKKLCHWAIFIPTSTQRGVGNYYEIVGGLHEGYHMRHSVNVRHPGWEQYGRGTHLVGYIHLSFFDRLETHLSRVPIQQGRSDWNCQTWVVEALRGMNHTHMYAVQMAHGHLLRQMEIVEVAWRVGKA